MLMLDAERVRENLSMTECIRAMEDLYLNFSRESPTQPMRILTRIDSDSIILTMPSHSTRLGLFAVKIVSEYRENPRRYSLQVQGGVIVLMNSKNSEVLAILDSAEVTAIRTGAVSGLATRLLAKKDAKSVAIIGSGQQAGTQLEALCRVRDIRRAKVFSRNYSNAERFAKEMTTRFGIPVMPEIERKNALKDVDIIVLATNSASPVLDWSEVPEGTHINSIGTLPERREVDVETVCNSRLYVDFEEGVRKEAGDVMNAIESGRISSNHIVGDLSDLLTGICPARTNDKEVTLFKSVGFGMQDVYASSVIYEKLSKKSS